ncbi:hypothetical protein UAW_02353 [Enterococcus haemoperoxidus ATCC BAA-382]|uniref:Uncharacterized protein n=1 Tax=Enterococcus haemoperoxidus ATCC BAA-382 TaxID=1158608 RepID=R2T2X6_9ENTE|nr:hypothetical protein [Enterococcus haemoperoxidus]EOH94599.1 hypothetical protein UAW_02353 [Enterococcus haemoperoxidus ATCC BAA-382]EOT63241.1 hypothetical protein I583_00041 [Enterococcus haemoperoxidus ATCC BAA-382]OJG54092.1 hypothetical protein RV06_GL000485 [Enterococcus haemoperoxidus]
MNRKKKLDTLLKCFNEDKKFITDGYYRIRTIIKQTIELAYIGLGLRGKSVVTPQIMISIADGQAITLTVIGM